MPNFATMTLTGHAGRDFESRFTPQGKEVGNLSVALTTKGATFWFKVTVWSPKDFHKEIKKGDVVVANGRLEVGNWTDKEGKPRTDLSLVASECYRIGGHGQSGGGSTSQAQAAKRDPGPSTEEARGVAGDDDMPF